MPDFEVRASEVVRRAAHLELREETLVTPDGDEVVRFVVRHPGAVAVVPIDAEDRFIFVRQYRIAPRAQMLEIPAGKRDVEGEAPVETAARELAEEVGLEAGRMEELANFYNSPGFCDEYTTVFLASELQPLAHEYELKAEERHMVVERIPRGEVLDMIRSGAISDAKTLVGVLLAQHHLDGSGPGLGS